MQAPTWAVEFRPQSFQGVLGQGHIAPVLRQMVRRMHEAEDGKFPPALVFCGTRGTGKTTTARILARALNCEDSVEGEPCDQCHPCKSILSGSAPGVEEMDMASRGSVDDIRGIKASTALSFSLDWRVFLLDEVHSASRAAFDALLKLLEEPPPQTLFVLLTTEPDRIPDTIRSRSMEFEFRRIGALHIEERIRHVAKAEGIDQRVDDAVYALVAHRAKGGMRDAIMALEQLSYRDGQITEAVFRESFGVTDTAERLLDAALKGDRARGFDVMRHALASAQPPVPLVGAMVEGLTALIYAASGVKPETAAVSSEWLEAYKATPGNVVMAGLGKLWEIQGRLRPGDPSAVAYLLTGYALFCDVVSPLVVAPLGTNGHSQMLHRIDSDTVRSHAAGRVGDRVLTRDEILSELDAM